MAFSEPSELEAIRSEMASTAAEIRREMRAYALEFQSAIKEGEGRTGQLDARLRMQETLIDRLGKLEQRLTEEAQQNANQTAAIELQSESIARLMQAIEQKDEAIAAKNISEGIAWRIGRIGLFAALGFSAAYFLQALAVAQIWVVAVLIVPLGTILLIATGNEHLIGDIVSAAKQKFLG